MTEPNVSRKVKKNQPNYKNRKYHIDDLIGKRFGRLTIIKEVDQERTPAGRLRRLVLCQCDCGNQPIVPLLNILNNGLTKSCGCISTDRIVKLNKTHGMSEHPLYRIRAHMIERCSNPNDKSYKNYGGRGIKVCDEWLEDFQNFYDWAIKYWKPGLMLDRKNVNRGYSESNCRFVDGGVSSRNTRRLRCNNTTGYRGVQRVRSGKWIASIRYNYEPIHLGTFEDPIDAARAYDKKAKTLDPEYPLNFPNR